MRASASSNIELPFESCASRGLTDLARLSIFTMMRGATLPRGGLEAAAAWRVTSIRAARGLTQLAVFRHAF